MKASLLLLIGLLGCEKHDVADSPAPAVTRAAPTGNDPARINGTWDYRTESNCGTGGTGTVSFRWDPERQLYREGGEVRWPETDLTVRWWGDARYEHAVRKLAATIENSLGDKVSGAWRLEGDGPDRLVIDWKQTNGCNGNGIATRRR